MITSTRSFGHLNNTNKNWETRAIARGCAGQIFLVTKQWWGFFFFLPGRGHGNMRSSGIGDKKCLAHIFFIFLFLFYFILFYIYLFIYLFMAVLGLRFCVRAFSSCGNCGPLFIAVRGLVIIAASLVAEHRLQTRRLSKCGSRA